ncbi:MAG: EGF domain-containing protein [Kofleriaceae bacterium]
MKVFAFAMLIAVSAACGSVGPGIVDAAVACQPACGANATCQAGTCACDDGFTGDGQTCTDVDECATGNGGCAAEAVCTNTAGGNTCACGAGYTGDGMTCADIDECATNNGGCAAEATCANLPGSRVCTCNPGQVGDGVTCRPVWTRVATFPGIRINPDNFGGLAVGAGSKLFFGPRTNDPTQTYLRSYDLGTGQLSGPLALPTGSQTDFCACGLTSVFLSNGTTLYLLGNFGQKYDPGLNRWAAVTSYAAPFQRGEAAAAYDAVSNAFLLVGGRSNEGSAIKMQLPGEAFSAEPGTLPVGMSSGVGFAPAGAPITFVAGGDLGGGKALVSHTTGSTGWTRLADAPQSLSRPDGMGGFMGKLWVLAGQGQGLFVYDPMTNAWAPGPLPTPPGATVATMVAGDAYLLADTGTATELYRLTAIQ